MYYLIFLTLNLDHLSLPRLLVESLYESLTSDVLNPQPAGRIQPEEVFQPARDYFIKFIILKNVI